MRDERERINVMAYVDLDHMKIENERENGEVEKV
jgi:hypothetical protein